MATKTDTTNTVRLGLMPPLTGLVELYGPEICHAAIIACDEVNQNGGVLGRPLEIIIEDDGSLPDTAVPAAERLIDEHLCVAIIGNLLSNSRISVASRVAEPKRIPFLNFSFYEGSIDSRYFFNFAALPNQQIEKMIPYMAEKFGPKMYFVGNNYEWPHGSIDAAKRALLAVGGEVLGEEYFDIGTSDFSELLERVHNSGADVFVPYAAGSDQVALLTQFTERGLKARMKVVMGHYDEAMVGNLTPEVREGFYSSNTYFMSVNTPENDCYLQRLAALPDVTGIWPEGNGVLTNFGEGTYVCVKAFADAANRAGSLDPEALVDALETVSISSPQGTVVMDADTHHAMVNTYLTCCTREGHFTVIESFGPIAPEIPQRYRYDEQPALKETTPSVHTMTMDEADDRWRLIGILNIDLTAANSAKMIEPVSSSLVNNSLATITPDLIDHLSFHHKLLVYAAETGRVVHLPECLIDRASSLIFEIMIKPMYFGGICKQLAVFYAKGKSGRQSDSPYEANNNSGILTAVLAISGDGVINYVHTLLLNELGYINGESLLQQPLDTLLELPDDKCLDDLKAEVETDPLTLGLKNADGSMSRIPFFIEHNHDTNNAFSGYLLLCNISSSTRASKRTEDNILTMIDTGVISTDQEGIISHANENACALFGYPKDELIGLSVNLLLPPHKRKNHQIHINNFVSSGETNMSMNARIEISGYRKDGTSFPAEASIARLDKGENTTLIVTLRDITDRKAIEDNLIWQATHDPLTKLPNRSLIQDRVTNALARAEHSGKSIAVMFIDLDNFKLVNDSFGHDAGDRLLLEVGRRLNETVRPGDTVGRFGGDEFIILCDQITDNNMVHEIADRVSEKFRAPVKFENTEIFVTVSIGVVISSENNLNTDELLRHADTAMYAAKDSGRDNWKLFNEDIGDKSRQQLKIVNGLHTAIDKNELTLLYQPIIDIRTNRIKAVEALLRWHSEGEFIPPDVFIPLAETSGSILPIGRWVFDQACMMHKHWHDTYGPEAVPYMSINLSTRQLADPTIIAQFRKSLETTGADPRRIVLEITETSLMHDIESTIITLYGLGELGLSLAVDDFGTGYSSLSQIQRLPVDSLKIDKIFIDEISTNKDHCNIASAIITMGHTLGLRVTAEGVENKEQLKLLKRMNCDNVQGYYFSRPVSNEEIERKFITEVDERLTINH